MKKELWNRLLISPTASILEAIEVINKYPEKIAIVSGPHYKLLGTLTDGDVRRALLKNKTLDSLVTEAMNKSPLSCTRGANEESFPELMRDNQVTIIPVLDTDEHIVDIHTSDELTQKKKHKSPVLIMAGGKGERLFPLTENTPKPLLTVGDKPILQTIFETLIQDGFSIFYFSVNYLSKNIKDFFGDGSRWNVSISYLEEEKPLGTAGCLSLLQNEIANPLLIINGDLLTNINYSALLDFHIQNSGMATLCVREYDYQVPYGVVELDGLNLVQLKEKPINRMFVSAGLYVISPEALTFVPQDTFYNMTTL